MKRVLITGCSSGFGFDLVEEYLREGWYVIATLRNLEGRRNLFMDIEAKFADRLHLLELDVTKSSDHDKALKFLEEKKWNLDCLVNNAGYGLFGALEDLKEKEIREQFEVNYFGALFLTQKLLPLIRQSKGRIIVISSLVGFLGLPLGSLYSASKFAIEGLFESLSYELKNFGVQVCIVEPGQFRTSFSEKLKYGENSFDPFSPYFRFSSNFKAYRLSRSEKRGTPPDEVIDQIIRVSELKHMPLRVRCGKDSFLGYWSKWLLPECVYNWLVYKVFSSVIFESK